MDADPVQGDRYLIRRVSWWIIIFMNVLCWLWSVILSSHIQRIRYLYRPKLGQDFDTLIHIP